MFLSNHDDQVLRGQRYCWAAHVGLLHELPWVLEPEPVLCVCAPGFGMCEPDLNRMSGWKRSAKCSKRGIFGVKSRSGCYFLQAWQPLPPLSCIHIPRARLSTLFLSKDITNHKVSKGFKRHVPKIPQRIALTGKCCQWTRICHCSHEDPELRRCKADENVRLRKECPLSFAVSHVFIQDAGSKLGAPWW